MAKLKLAPLADNRPLLPNFFLEKKTRILI